MLLGLLFSLRGTTFIYQGQEIGMTNGAFDNLDEIMDIESHNVDKMAKGLGIINPFRWHLIRKTSRDNARTPMQWSADKNAGFTDGKPWLKLHPNYTEVNVQNDEADADGVSAFFKKINAFKKSSDVLKDGSFKEIYSGRSVYVFERELDGRKLTTVCNMSHKRAKLPIELGGGVVISNYSDKAEGKLRPYEFMLVESC